MKTARPKLSWLLPTFAILFTLAALAMPASVLYLRMRTAVRGGAPSVWMHSKQINLQVDRQDMLRFAILGTATWEQKWITGMHVPGMFGEVLVSLPTTWPDSWHPESIPLFPWRSISLPVFCLPFWCLIGSGLDRYFVKRRSHWSLLLVGTLLSVFLFFIAAGLSVMGWLEKDGSLLPQILGLCLWGVLFGIFPFTWRAQRRWAAISARA